MPLDKRPSHEIARESVLAIAAELKLDLESIFVPFSRSRNAEPRAGQSKPWESLNWKVTLSKDGRKVIETDYSQGVAHCPAYKTAGRKGASRAMINAATALEIETGKRAAFDFMDRARETRHAIPGPDIADVLHSLVMDSSVLDESCFEDWAATFGYDTDSRSAESTYRDCLAIALAMRNGIGNAGLERLREAAQEM